MYLRRAAGWCEEHGSPGEAFAYAHQAGDLAHAGRIALAYRDELASRGQIESLRLWLDRCTDTDIESDPLLSIAAAWVFGYLGEPARARRFLVAAERAPLDSASADGAASLRSALANLRSSMAPDGISQMLRDAELGSACEKKMGTQSLLSARRAMGAAYLLLGRPQEAIAVLRESLALATDRPELSHTRVFTLGYLVFAAAEVGERRDAQRWAVEASWLTAQQHLHDTIYGAIAYTAGALAHNQRGDQTRGRTPARERPAAAPTAPRGPMAQRRSRAALRRHQPRPRRRCRRPRTRAGRRRRATGIPRCRNAPGPVAASPSADQARTGLRTHTRRAPARRFPADASLAPGASPIVFTSRARPSRHTSRRSTASSASQADPTLSRSSSTPASNRQKPRSRSRVQSSTGVAMPESRLADRATISSILAEATPPRAFA